MSTDFQTAREALGAWLRQLRTEAGLEGKDLAAKVSWQPSKISRSCPETTRCSAGPMIVDLACSYPGRHPANSQ
ncbi:helix-turn-helix transcriptional regulator, partial [Streptomyces spectabilis]|uniref:helix-turn-helix domain-containing protein n=1 Tax=Streptomyces spectabilis TaxID=68270 RepID=UPI0033FCE73C